MFKKIIMTGLSVLFSINAFAFEQIIETELPLVWQKIITVSGGPAWTSPGKNQYLYPTLPFRQINYYVANSETSTVATGEIFFGLRRPVFPFTTGELGIGLGAASDADLSGTMAVNGVPNIGSYTYKVNHAIAELKGKLIANTYRVQPYISGGFGAGWNHSHDFRSATNNPLIFPAPGFATNTTIAFSYNLGIGVGALVSPHWQAGVGYEFADWGRSYLKNDLYTAIPGPYLTHLYTNELLFSISYLV